MELQHLGNGSHHHQFDKFKVFKSNVEKPIPFLEYKKQLIFYLLDRDFQNTNISNIVDY